MVQVLQAKAIFDCNGDEESELTFLEGDILTDGNEQKITACSAHLTDATLYTFFTPCRPCVPDL
jgi:hypothetical protein